MPFHQAELGTLVKAHYGKALKKENRDDAGVFDVYGSSGQVGFHIESICDYPTLVVGRKGSVGDIVWAPKGGWVIDTAYFLEILNPGILDLRYLFYALKRANLANKTITTSIPGLNRDDFYETKISLPPLAEQKRIAAILDKADSLRRKNQQAIQLADQFLRAVFLDMFAKQTGVKSCSVGELCEVKGGKRLPAGHDYVGDKSNHPYLRVVDFLNGSIDQTNLKYISHETHKKIQRYTITSDDVFISIAGSIGITGTIPSTLDGANLTENAAKLVIRNSSAILNEYLAYWLNTPEAQTQIANKTMSTSQPKLALFRIEELLCPLPPIADQMKFVSIKRKVFDGIVKMQNTESASSNLFNSLSQKAFAGEL
jgi:type I restriction enzyme S subunit